MEQKINDYFLNVIMAKQTDKRSACARVEILIMVSGVDPIVDIRRDEIPLLKQPG